MYTEEVPWTFVTAVGSKNRVMLLTGSHVILFQKLQQHTIPPNVLLWIINFLSSRTQAVTSCGQTSGWLPVSHKDPVLACKLCRLTMLSLSTLTDDTTLLVGQHSSVDIQQEFDNICSWSARNWLIINSDRTKEIVFHRPT